MATATDLVEGVTRVQHRDPELVERGYVGVFDRPHPINAEYAYIALDDGEEICVVAADWEPSATT